MNWQPWCSSGTQFAGVLQCLATTFQELTMYQTSLGLASAKSFDPVLLTEMALRSAEQFYCMNVSATGVLLQTQASAATALGLPDWSPVIAATTEQTRQVVSASTDQILQAAQQATEAITAFQRNASELVEEHSAKASEALQAGVEQLSSQARESVGRFNAAAENLTHQAADLTAEALESIPKPDLPLDPLAAAVHDALPDADDR
jgi:DNA anti-recombination protein RmuC